MVLSALISGYDAHTRHGRWCRPGLEETYGKGEFLALLHHLSLTYFQSQFDFATMYTVLEGSIESIALSQTQNLLAITGRENVYVLHIDLSGDNGKSMNSPTFTCRYSSLTMV